MPTKRKLAKKKRVSTTSRKRPAQKRATAKSIVVRVNPHIEIPPSPSPNVTVPVPRVEIAAPPPVVVPAPISQVTVPVPNVEVAAPPPVVVPAPITQVTVSPAVSESALRAGMLAYVGTVVEIITQAGAGSAEDAPNRIGLLEAVGERTVVLRPTIGNPNNSQIVYYSLAQIVGFRPSAPVVPGTATVL
ncbi:MAG: hypothetical protein K0Q59_1720 [Paenibacillus sp.]|jgi:hypothetical protein|nr:hypothetical protein [Paenibacillus sp.]